MLTVKEIAEMLKVSTRTVHRWLEEGKLKGYDFGGKAGWRVPEEALEEFLRQREKPMPRGKAK